VLAWVIGLPTSVLVSVERFGGGGSGAIFRDWLESGLELCDDMLTFRSEVSAFVKSEASSCHLALAGADYPNVGVIIGRQSSESGPPAISVSLLDLATVGACTARLSQR